MKWSVETLNAVVDAEVEELPADMLARFHYPLRLGLALKRAKEIKP